jgi:hypothetical protein
MSSRTRFKCFAAIAFAVILVPLGTCVRATADPDDPAPAPAPAPVPVADGAPAPDTGAIASAAPGFLAAPDGLKLTVSGKNESLLPVAPLTTAITSREYLVGGTFTGSVAGGDSTLAGGTLEAGYRIGCGIISDYNDLNVTAGITPGIRIPFTDAPTAGAFINGTVRVVMKPGSVNAVPVAKMPYKGSESRVTITGFRIKIDACMGQSFIQSFATLTSSTDRSDDIISYLGVVKSV